MLINGKYHFIIRSLVSRAKAQDFFPPSKSKTNQDLTTLQKEGQEGNTRGLGQPITSATWAHGHTQNHSLRVKGKGSVHRQG